jgi:hypothetical protein
MRRALAAAATTVAALVLSGCGSASPSPAAAVHATASARVRAANAAAAQVCILHKQHKPASQITALLAPVLHGNTREAAAFVAASLRTCQ